MGRLLAYFKNIPAKTGEYLKLLGSDYKSACLDVVKDSKEKPFKAGVIAAFLAGLTYAYKTNPSERDMLNELAERRQLLSTLPNTIHNPRSDDALNWRTNFLNQNRLQYIDCFFFSLLVEQPDDSMVRIYESQDKNLKKGLIKEIYENTADIGAFGRWFKLHDSFINYDVNQQDIKDLPEASNKD